jgi:hypothetical protein
VSAHGTPRAFACALLFLAAACGSPVDGEPAPDLRGTWSYTATQVAPAIELTGTMTVTHQSGVSFDAQLQVQERDAQGNVRTRSGIVSGRTLGDDGVDFDAFLDFGARRHVGRLHGDSITGTWAELDVVSLTGSFQARRR